MENVALKLKAQGFKDKLRKTSANNDVLGGLLQTVRVLKQEKQTALNEFHEHVATLTPMFEHAIRDAKQIKDNTTAQLKDITSKYLKEQTQRKLLYNKVQELRGNIRYVA